MCVLRSHTCVSNVTRSGCCGIIIIGDDHDDDVWCSVDGAVTGSLRTCAKLKAFGQLSTSTAKHQACEALVSPMRPPRAVQSTFAVAARASAIPPACRVHHVHYVNIRVFYKNINTHSWAHRSPRQQQQHDAKPTTRFA